MGQLAIENFAACRSQLQDEPQLSTKTISQGYRPLLASDPVSDFRVTGRSLGSIKLGFDVLEKGFPAHRLRVRFRNDQVN